MIDQRRYKKLTTHDYVGGPVCYWMNRDQRAHDNWALLLAQEFALKHKVPLMVVFNLAPGFLGGGYRQHAFKVRGLQEVAETLGKKNISFFLVSGDHTERDIVECITAHQVGLLVTDFFPLRKPRAWVDYVRKNVTIPFYGVDAHNIVPLWETSTKREYAARTIRPKIHKKLSEFLTDIPSLKKHPHAWQGNVPSIAWKKILDEDSVDRSISEVSWIVPGEHEAKKALKKFINDRLDSYAESRNDATVRGQSDLSPYLHYGQLSAQRVAYEAVQASGNTIEKILDPNRNAASGEDSVAAFLEELIVRRELADNFCFYTEAYDAVEGFPEWAQKTLEKHRNDVREYTYTKRQLEQAKTHDELWNAAQREMVHTGKMHGYMRMYWAKKILQWTTTVSEAMKIAIYLNDTYELDGRDPNGYVGIAWSMGGVHDRPWFERPLFGTVRYMAESGVRKRFDIREYIAMCRALENKE